jgi:hypothetical protein
LTRAASLHWQPCSPVGVDSVKRLGVEQSRSEAVKLLAMGDEQLRDVAVGDLDQPVHFAVHELLGRLGGFAHPGE